jgi:hypothetical protein
MAFFAISFRPQNPIEITGDFVRAGSHLKICHGAHRDKPYHILKLSSISKWNSKKQTVTSPRKEVLSYGPIELGGSRMIIELLLVYKDQLNFQN